jgi:hypothetical protein
MKPQDFAPSNFGQAAGERRGFKACMDRVAGLRMRALKVQQVSGLLAHAGSAQSNTGRGERAQSSGQSGR